MKNSNEFKRVQENIEKLSNNKQLQAEKDFIKKKSEELYDNLAGTL